MKSSGSHNAIAYYPNPNMPSVNTAPVLGPGYLLHYGLYWWGFSVCDIFLDGFVLIFCVFEMWFHYITQTSLKLMALLPQSSRAGFTGTHHHLTGLLFCLGWFSPNSEAYDSTLTPLQIIAKEQCLRQPPPSRSCFSWKTNAQGRGQSCGAGQAFLSGKGNQG